MNGQELISQLTSSAIVIYLLEFLKRSKYVPWITAETKTLNRVIMWCGSALGAIGVHFAFDATKSADGTYVLTITGLTFVSVLHGAWHVLNQAAMTQLAYDAIAKPTPSPVILPSSLPGGSK